MNSTIYFFSFQSSGLKSRGEKILILSDKMRYLRNTKRKNYLCGKKKKKKNGQTTVVNRPPLSFSAFKVSSKRSNEIKTFVFFFCWDQQSPTEPLLCLISLKKGSSFEGKKCTTRMTLQTAVSTTPKINVKKIRN